MEPQRDRPAAFDASDRLIASRIGVRAEDLADLCDASPEFARLVHDVGNELTVEIGSAQLEERRRGRAEAD